MFSTVEMSRLTMAGPSNNLDEVLRLCANLGNVHQAILGDVDGITVGRHIQMLMKFQPLTKVRSAISTLNSTNGQGPFLLRKLNLESFSKKLILQRRQSQRRQTQLLKFPSYRKE